MAWGPEGGGGGGGNHRPGGQAQYQFSVCVRVIGRGTWCQEWDPFSKVVKMKNYMAPEAIGEGNLSDQWLRFKREFAQFLVAVDKGKATEEVKLAIF